MFWINASLMLITVIIPQSWDTRNAVTLFLYIHLEDW